MSESVRYVYGGGNSALSAFAVGLWPQVAQHRLPRISRNAARIARPSAAALPLRGGPVMAGPAR